MLDHPITTTKIHESLLSKEIQDYEFPKKFFTPTFDYYSRVSYLVQYLRHFQDKMVIYSRNDSIKCLTFLVSLKGVTSDGSTRCHRTDSIISLS